MQGNILKNTTDESKCNSKISSNNTQEGKGKKSRNKKEGANEQKKRKWHITENEDQYPSWIYTKKSLTKYSPILYKKNNTLWPNGVYWYKTRWILKINVTYQMIYSLMQ